MNLIAISPNILVNPDWISSVLQEKVKGVMVTCVYVGDKRYILQVPLKEFYKNIGFSSMSSDKQHFAG